MITHGEQEGTMRVRPAILLREVQEGGQSPFTMGQLVTHHGEDEAHFRCYYTGIYHVRIIVMHKCILIPNGLGLTEWRLVFNAFKCISMAGENTK